MFWILHSYHIVTLASDTSTGFHESWKKRKWAAAGPPPQVSQDDELKVLREEMDTLVAKISEQTKQHGLENPRVG